MNKTIFVIIFCFYFSLTCFSSTVPVGTMGQSNAVSPWGFNANFTNVAACSNATGDGDRTFCAIVTAATGNTFTFYNGGVGGTGIFDVSDASYGHWWNTSNDTPTTLLTSFLSHGPYDVIIMINGENEMDDLLFTGLNRTLFITHIQKMWDYIRAQSGANTILLQTTPAIDTAYVPSAGVASIYGWSNVQQWMTDAVDTYKIYNPTAHIYVGAINYDINGDPHYSDWGTANHSDAGYGYKLLGTRFAQTYLYDQGLVSFYQGPTITNFVSVDSTHTLINLTSNGTTDFTPTSGITGFIVNNNGTPVSISSAVRTSATSITLTHAAVTGTETVSYAYTTNAVYTNPIFSNSTPALLVPMNQNITNSTATYTISGTVSGSVQSGVTITLSGTSSASTTTDGSGNYSFMGLISGSYLITATLNGYTFLPVPLAVAITNTNLTGENFVSTTATAVPGAFSVIGNWIGNGQ